MLTRPDNRRVIIPMHGWAPKFASSGYERILSDANYGDDVERSRLRRKALTSLDAFHPAATNKLGLASRLCLKVRVRMRRAAIGDPLGR